MLHDHGDHGDHGNIWQPQTAEGPNAFRKRGHVVRCGHWLHDTSFWLVVSRIPYFQHFSTIFGMIITDYCLVTKTTKKLWVDTYPILCLHYVCLIILVQKGELWCCVCFCVKFPTNLATVRRCVALSPWAHRDQMTTTGVESSQTLWLREHAEVVAVVGNNANSFRHGFSEGNALLCSFHFQIDSENPLVSPNCKQSY